MNQQFQSTPSTTVNDIDDDFIDWDAMCPICGDEVENENEGGEVQCDGCDQWIHLRCIHKSRSWANRIKYFYYSLCKENK